MRAAPAGSLRRGRQHRDEDEVVDPEHDLHRDQGRERGPGGGFGDEPLQEQVFEEINRHGFESQENAEYNCQADNPAY